MLADPIISLRGENGLVERGGCQERILRIRHALYTAADAFIDAGTELRAAYRAEEWKSLGLENFTAYCAQFDLSDSWAYDLIRIADMAQSFPEYRPRMIAAGISKMRLLLPHVDTETTAAQVEGLLESATEHSWKELNNELNPREPLPPAIAYCPGCGVKLHQSRAAKLELAEG